MPTLYTNTTETAAIDEFLKKIEKEQGVKSYERPDPPDVIIQTHKGETIWAEVTTIVRTPELAKFINENGLYNPKKEGSIFSFEEAFGGPLVHISNLKEKILEQVYKKDAKSSYEKELSLHGKGTLILYLEDLIFSSQDLDFLMKNPIQFHKLEKFSSVYLYIRKSFHTHGPEIKEIGGFYPLYP